jgi:hypothetical protein
MRGRAGFCPYTPPCGRVGGGTRGVRRGARRVRGCEAAEGPSAGIDFQWFVPPPFSIRCLTFLDAGGATDPTWALTTVGSGSIWGWLEGAGSSKGRAGGEGIVLGEKALHG